MKSSTRLLALVATVLATIFLAHSLQKSSLGNGFEQAAYDRRFKLRGPLAEPKDTPITILAIDEETFTKIGKPLVFWQPDFAAVINALVETRAAAVGVDFIFGDVSEWDPEGQRQLLSTLIQASQSEVPVILGYRAGGTEEEPLPFMFVMAAGEEGVAFVNLTTDTDDFVRRQELFFRSEDGELAPGFAWALSEAFLDQTSVEFPPVPGYDRTVLINYRGLDYYETIPFWEAWEAAKKADRQYFRRFSGRILLIGEWADQDRHATPLYYWAERSSDRPMTRTPGVEIHAHVLSTLVERDFMRQLPNLAQLGLTTLLALAVGVLCFFLPPLVGVASALGAVASYLTVSQLLFSRGVWVFMVGPLAAAFLTVGAAQAINYVFEGRQKRRLRRLFNRYVDDDVVERILAAPGLTLAGEKKEVSILFSDIRGFTARSESMDPEILVAQLNRYFEKMVDAIQSHQGTVDKFLGDGIMAVFGAPLDDSDSALHAVQSALTMLRQLDTLNSEFAAEAIEPIRIGIGIHSGEVIVGNIGSSRKVEYTAIGDVVNATSRIEGLTRTLDADLLISSVTYELVKGLFKTEYLGGHAVKGKSETLGIYRVDP